MKEEITDALLRQFLLGKVDDEERQRIEGLFLTDSTMRERVLAVEQDLVEDYLEDSLSSGDKEKFLLHYAQTPEQQRKLRITKSIKDWAVTESSTGEANAVTNTSEVKARDIDQRDRPSVSLWTRLLERLRARPLSLLPIAAVIVLAVVLVVVWVNRRLEQQKHFAIEQELAQLNDPANLRDVPPGRQTLLLQPGTLRSSASQSAELPLGSDVATVELRLRWVRKESYPTYRAVLRRTGDEKAFTLPPLFRGSDGTIRLLLTTRILTRGLYQLHVTGITPDGAARETEEYQFTVVN